MDIRTTVYSSKNKNVQNLLDKYTGLGSMYDKTLRRALELKCPMYNDGIIDLCGFVNAKEINDPNRDYVPRRIENNTEDHVECMKNLQDMYNDLVEQKMAIDVMIQKTKDLMLSFTNTFSLEYDVDMFSGAWLYQGKFIMKSKHYTYAFATEDLKKDYDACKKLLADILKDIDWHNFTIVNFDHMRKASFEFTVTGCPGVFSIYFPLFIKGYGSNEDYLDSPRRPMQMGLGWRRKNYAGQYNFNDFGTYHLDEIYEPLHKFISEQKWKDYCDFKAGVKSYEYADDGTAFEVTKYLPEHLVKRAEDELKKEIEEAGKEMINKFSD